MAKEIFENLIKETIGLDKNLFLQFCQCNPFHYGKGLRAQIYTNKFRELDNNLNPHKLLDSHAFKRTRYLIYLFGFAMIRCKTKLKDMAMVALRIG